VKIISFYTAKRYNKSYNVAMKSAEYDVTIIGGGVAGCASAYTAAKFGLKALIVEKNNYLGGLASGGLVVPAMKSENKNLNTNFFKSLVKNAKKIGAQITYCDENQGWFNPIKLKIVLEDMLSEAGANILYESTPKNFFFENEKDMKKSISCVEISNKILSLSCASKYFVDATGDGNFSKILSCEFWSDESQKQPASLRFILSNVNLDEFRDFILKLDGNREVTTACDVDNQPHFSTAYTWDKSKKWALEPLFEKALSENVLKPSDCAYFQIFTIAGMPSSVAFNCPRVFQDDYDNPFSLSRGLIEARQAILRLTNFCQTYLEGFEKAEITNIADLTGYRESGRVKCLYDYSVEDMLNEKKFENPAVFSDYPIDIHSNQKDDSTLKHVAPYMLPVESLISKNYTNLYIVGRCLGADFKSQAALRVQPNCMAMGEAAVKDMIKKLGAR